MNTGILTTWILMKQIVDFIRWRMKLLKVYSQTPTSERFPEYMIWMHMELNKRIKLWTRYIDRDIYNPNTDVADCRSYRAYDLNASGIEEEVSLNVKLLNIPNITEGIGIKALYRHKYSLCNLGLLLFFLF